MPFLIVLARLYVCPLFRIAVDTGRRPNAMWAIKCRGGSESLLKKHDLIEAKCKIALLLGNRGGQVTVGKASRHCVAIVALQR